MTIIFDFDGTLADSFEYVLSFLQGEARDARVLSKKEKDGYRGLSMKDMALRLGIPYWRLPFVFFKGRRTMRDHLPDIQPFDGMVELVKQLKAEDVDQYILSSNSSKNIRKFLKRHEISDCFCGIQGNAGILGKPPLIRQMIVRYRIRRESCWIIGDEVADIRAAKRVGLRCVGVTWGFSKAEELAKLNPDSMASTTDELLEALE